MQSSRIHEVDALRGFSLAGIVLVHMIENYIGGPTPAEAVAVANQGILDGIVNGLVTFLVRGKFFALFAFLFGLSFFIQMDRASERGNYYGGRFFWRLILLLLIGGVHHLFYRGDILTVYALLGMLLIPFYRLNTKWILALTAILFLGAGRFIVFALTGAENLFSDFNMNPESPEVLHYYNLLKNGSIIEVFMSNATEGHLAKLDFQLGVFGRGYLTFGFFMLGLLMGRLRFFEQYRQYRKKLRDALLWSLVVLLVAFLAMFMLFANVTNNGAEPVRFDTWTAMFALTAYDLSNIAMTLMLILAFLLIYMKVKGERFLVKFAPYGRTALTNYVMQSVIGTFILYGWGLGYLGTLRNSYVFLIALALIVFQMLISKWWLSRYRYGPLEWLWRSLTHFKLFPFKVEK